MGYPYEYKIGTSVTGLAYLPLWHLPWPDSAPYRPWSRTEKRGDGLRAGFGYPSVIWNYDNLGQATLWGFLKLFPDEDAASVQIYIRTYKDWAVRLDPANFYAIMHRPLDGDGKQIHARVRANRAAYSGVTIEFTHLEEQ